MPASHILVSLSSKKINSEKEFFKLKLLINDINFDPFPIKIILGFSEELILKYASGYTGDMIN